MGTKFRTLHVANLLYKGTLSFTSPTNVLWQSVKSLDGTEFRLFPSILDSTGRSSMAFFFLKNEDGCLQGSAQERLMRKAVQFCLSLNGADSPRLSAWVHSSCGIGGFE